MIQVTQRLDNPTSRGRDVRALQDAIKIVKAQCALILSDANGDDFKINGTPVDTRSATKCLLKE
jgi:hypothetical protein